MNIGDVSIAEDKDFEKLLFLVNNNDGWKLEYNKSNIRVWTKEGDNTTLKMIKLKAVYKDIQAALLYDVIHDPWYRKVWDKHMIDAYDIGCLNPNNDVGYYALKCPPPLKNRDFVLQRSWLDTGNEYMILNHSVFHESVPPKKGFIRGFSYLTGYVIQPTSPSGCELSYVSHSDPRGDLPPWIVNKCTQIFAPKMVKRLHKASSAYEEWKHQNNPELKPWRYPEQISIPRINISQCVKSNIEKNWQENLDESVVDESCFKDEFFNDADEV